MREFTDQGKQIGVSRSVVITANSLWYITNFREGLVRAIESRDLAPVLVAPADGTPLRSGQAVFVPLALERSGTNAIGDLRVALSYLRTLRQHRPNAVFSFTIKPNIYAAIAGRLLGVPVFPTVTGLGTVFIRGGGLMALVERMYRFAFKRCPVVFFENRHDLDTFVERWIVDISQARLVPGCGVDLDRFAEVPLPSGPPKFLLIARLLGDKGVREFVEAARILRGNVARSQFQLLGPLDPANRTSIGEAEVREWADEGLIEYFGETDDVRPFIAAATAVVLPSYREGLPRSLLEGAAMGRPLIATDVPGCRQVVDDGVNGFFCEARNPAALAQAMNRLIELPEERRAIMGQAGRAKVEREFDEARVIEAYLEALDRYAPSADMRPTARPAQAKVTN